jgi:hypothetical protein
MLAMIMLEVVAAEWTARMAPCTSSSQQQNQSWSFAAGTLQVTTTSKMCVSTFKAGDGHLQLVPCNPKDPSQQWKMDATSRLVTGSPKTDGCFCIRENVHSNPGILYVQKPCRNTTNEQWIHDTATNHLTLQCTEGNCVQWKNWCLTAQDGLNPTPGPYLTPTPSPTPAVPDAPLAATEMYRSRVHTAGHYCCPGGAAYCNASSAMRQDRCSGYYDFGSPQLILSKNGTLLSFNQGERTAHADDNNWIDMVLTRSFDMGETWLPLQVIHSENTWKMPPSEYQSIGQDTAVLDNDTGVIHMLFTRNNTEMFATSSSDDGATWAAPTPVPDKPGCPSCWIAPSFSAVQLKYNKEHLGDLVACLDYSNLPGHEGGGPVERAGTMISSDHGKSWSKGATGVIGDECAIAELPNGTIVLNARDYVNQSAHTVHRSIAWSHDGGRSFTPVFFPETLPDPVWLRGRWSLESTHPLRWEWDSRYSSPTQPRNLPGRTSR